MSRAVASLALAGTESLEATAASIATAINVRFEPHQSGYRGGDYLLAGDWKTPYTEHVIVQRNEEADEPAEPVEAPTIVYVETTDRADAIITALEAAQLVLIRRDDWEVP